ncbi:MAG: hypothetical protein U0670_22140 [Anaerolineae bacterium]
MYFLRGDYPAAVRELSLAPDDYYRGTASLAAGQYAEAEADLHRFITGMTREIQRRLDAVYNKPKLPDYLKRSEVGPHYISLYIAVGRQEVYREVVRICDAALTAGSSRDTTLFCRAAAYEQQREFFKALDDYRQISEPELQAGVDLALEHSQKCALRVLPSDRQLMQPHLRYCVNTNGSYEFFDLDHYEQKANIGSMREWTEVAIDSHADEFRRYYQQPRTINPRSE